MLIIESTKIIIPKAKEIYCELLIGSVYYYPAKYLMGFYNKMSKDYYLLEPYIKINGMLSGEK